VDRYVRSYKRPGGVIWHTTGSGKSLTMVVLAKALSLEPSIKNPKVVIVEIPFGASDTTRRVRETHHPRQVAVRFTHRTIYSHPLSSSFALFRVRRFIAALVFFDLAPIIRYPM
jgi:hypothetical protein